MYDRAVAGQAGTVAIGCSHYNSVFLPTLQVSPAAGSGVGETLVSVSIQACCFSRIGFGTIAGPPADRTHINLTLYIGHHIAGDTWGCGRRMDMQVTSKPTDEVKNNAYYGVKYKNILVVK